MDASIGSNDHIRSERGGRGGGAGPRRIGRGARNMSLKGGTTTEPSVKFRNKTWKRDDATPQDEVERSVSVEGAETRNDVSSLSTAWTPTSFGAHGKGFNGIENAPQKSSNVPVFGSGTFGTSAFGALKTGTSAFSQSAFQPSSNSAFTPPAAPSPPKRNAFGALIDPDSGQPISVFGQPQASPPAFGAFSQTPSTFGTAYPNSEAFPRKVSGLNAAAAEFKPGSAFSTASNAFGTKSVFSQGSTPPAPTISSGSIPNPSFVAPQSAFSTSSEAQRNFGATSVQPLPVKSAFGSPRPIVSQGKDTRRAFAPFKGDALAQAIQASPISASSREGGHISTAGFRFKHRPRWKTHGVPSTPPSHPSPPKVAPPYRVPPDVQRDIDRGSFATDSRFPGNRFLELKALRPSMRAHSIKHKLISDPEHRTDLTGAITVVGTCMDMCPEFERHEREFQKDVDDWEKIPGTNPKRIDHARAVKKYRRSAAGNDEPLESDLRPPVVLKGTLDYLFYELLDKHGLEATYAFIRDRTRAIRTDFTIQHEKGPIAIECFERIARFHILAVHRFCERDDVRGFDYWQEIEQMMKTLQSLMQFYDDNEGKFDSPNEAEFRSYYILAHIRDTNSMRRLQSLAPHIFMDPVLQTAIEFRSYAQRNTHLERRSGNRAAKLKFRNSEACLNAFTRFFKRVRSEGTSYLMACLLEYHFGGVRKGAIHSLWKAYTTRHRPLPTTKLMEFLGLDDEEKTLEVARRFGMASVEESGEAGGTAAVQLNKNSKFDYANQMSQRHSMILVETKLEGLPDIEIVDGRFENAGVTWWPSQAEASPSAILMSPPPEPHIQVTRKPSLVNAVIPQSAPAPSYPSSSFGQWSSVSTSFTNQNIFNPQDTEQNPPPLGDVFPDPSASEFTNLPTSSALVSPSDTLPAPAFTPAPPRSDAPGHAEKIPSISPFAPRAELVFTPTLQDQSSLQPLQPAQLQKSPISSRTVSTEQQVLTLSRPGEDAEVLHARPKAPSPRPTQEELLYEKQQALLRASALARTQADRHLRFKILFTTFTLWKRNVMNRGLARVFREEQEAQFRRSIQEMGLSTNSPIGGKGKQKEVYHEEDLVPWEETSQASSSTIMRRKPRKSVKRADDDMTLSAIKEAEEMRMKLWEPGTFLQFVVRRVRDELLSATSPLPNGWQIWLSTTTDNASTSEWLRLKFGADSSTSSTGIPGLYQIPLSRTDDLPAAHPYSAGLIVFDSSALVHKSKDADHLECQRLSRLISSLPADRHYAPSVLLFHWTESEDLSNNMSSLLDGLQRDNEINAWRSLSFINDGRHFDDQFAAGIQQLPMDTVGKLVEKTTIDDVYKMFYQPWDTALDQGINMCQLNNSETFNWILYGTLLSVLISYLNRTASEVLRVCNIQNLFEPLPTFNASQISDQHSAYDALIKYLVKDWMAENQDASLLRMELIADQSAGRELYVRAVPERLAHLTLCKLRASVTSSVFFLAKSRKPHSGVTSFTESLNTSLAQLESPFPSSLSKKRFASEVFESSHSFSRIVPEAKRRKHGPPVVSNGISSRSPPSSGHSPKQDPLARLRATVAKARRSVEDLRADRSFSPPGSESDVWSPTRDTFSPEILSRQSPLRNDSIPNGRASFISTLKPDIDLPLIPPDSFGLIPAKPAHALASFGHHNSPPSIKKVKKTDPLERFHPYLDGRDRERPTIAPLPSPARMRGAASLTPRKTESEATGTTLAKLKENLRHAQRVVEDSRRARSESEGA